MEKTEKCKKWVYVYRLKDFVIENAKKHMRSIHFIGVRGPTEEKPDPILATLI